MIPIVTRTKGGPTLLSFLACCLQLPAPFHLILVGQLKGEDQLTVIDMLKAQGWIVDIVDILPGNIGAALSAGIRQVMSASRALFIDDDAIFTERHINYLLAFDCAAYIPKDADRQASDKLVNEYLPLGFVDPYFSVVPRYALESFYEGEEPQPSTVLAQLKHGAESHYFSYIVRQSVTPAVLYEDARPWHIYSPNWRPWNVEIEVFVDNVKYVHNAPDLMDAARRASDVDAGYGERRPV